MSVSIWQILLVAVLFMLLFGRGKVPQLMTDIAQGIKNFKAGMKEDEPTSNASDATPTHATPAPTLADQRETSAQPTQVASKAGQ